MGWVEYMKSLVDAIPEEIRMLFGHVASAALYAGFYTFVVSYGQSWDVAFAATAGFRAVVHMVVEMLPLPKTTKAKETKPRRRFVL